MSLFELPKLPRGGGNLLRNGYFRVNQRGQTTYTGLGYTVDGWRIVHANVTVDVLAKGIRLTSTGGGGAIRQYIENGALHEGKVLTFAAKIDGNVYWITGTVPPVPASGIVAIAGAGFAGNRFAIQLYMESSGFMFVVIGANTADTMPVEFAELVNGKTPLLLGPEDGAIELARCHRFYRKYDTTGISMRWSFHGIILNNRQPRMYIDGPPMRTNPAFNILGDTVSIYYSGGYYQADTSGITEKGAFSDPKTGGGVYAYFTLPTVPPITNGSALEISLNFELNAEI
jgi:hypothetical protein